MLLAVSSKLLLIVTGSAHSEPFPQSLRPHHRIEAMPLPTWFNPRGLEATLERTLSELLFTLFHNFQCDRHEHKASLIDGICS